MYRLMSAAASLAAFLALLAVACNDDKPQTVEIERPAQPEITPEQDQTEPQPTAAATGPTRGPDDDELARRAALFSEAEFRASYVMTGQFIDGNFNGTLTWYQQPGMARGDFVGQVGGQEIDIVLIPGPGYPSEEFLYFCRRQDRSCIEAAPKSEQDQYPEEAAIIVFASLLVGAEEFSEAVVITGTSERIIAGEEVLCFRAQGLEAASFVTGEVCATEDGIALVVTESAPEATLSLEASEFTREVSDDAFELPYALEEGG